MWNDHQFSQRRKTTERAVGGWGLEFIGERGDGQNLEKWVDSIRGVLIK